MFLMMMVVKMENVALDFSCRLVEIVTGLKGGCELLLHGARAWSQSGKNVRFEVRAPPAVSLREAVPLKQGEDGGGGGFAFPIDALRFLPS